MAERAAAVEKMDPTVSQHFQIGISLWFQTPHQSMFSRECQNSHGPRPGVLRQQQRSSHQAPTACMFQTMPHHLYNQTCHGPCSLFLITFPHIHTHAYLDLHLLFMLLCLVDATWLNNWQGREHWQHKQWDQPAHNEKQLIHSACCFKLARCLHRSATKNNYSSSCTALQNPKDKM